MIEKITQLRPENETNIAEALRKTRLIFSNTSGDYLKHSIIITDGIPTSKNQDVTYRELESKIFLEIAKMKRMGITISVVCIRDELEENDSSLAKKIASIGGGSFNLVMTQDLLDQILRDYSNIKKREI